ncbi:ATP-binding protein [Alteribacillus sp. HJP-4]|uniref:sensor histidine kinase n=1 Tax=Alteribacillus sp. HJP-4 TaxID=2775394 RepID=UPI0035CD1F33
MKIKTKIQLYATIWMLLLLLATNTAIYYLFNQITSDSELTRLQSQADTIVETINDSDNLDSRRLFTAYLPANGMIRVIENNENTIQTVTKEDRFRELPYSFSTSESASSYVTEEGERYGMVSRPMIWENGEVVTLQLSEHLVSLENNMNGLRIVLLISSLFVLIPTIIGGRLLGNLFLRPLRSAVHTMQDIQERGELKKINIDDQSKDEIYEMGETFNHMIDRLQENFEKQKNFVSDASHELKTPLSIIDSYTRMLKRWGTQKPDVMEESIEAILTESTRMKRMLEQMLMLARDESTEELQRTSFDIAGLAAKAAQLFTASYNRHISADIPDQPVFVFADEEKLKQVLYILLDNAVKYSEADVWISIKQDEKTVQAVIKDSGSGIPEEEQEKIFNRFYRLDKARSRETGGSGLGLAIAAEIIKAHLGEITVESRPGEGAAFIITLPTGT